MSIEDQENEIMKKYNAEIEAILNSTEKHPQLVSMAMNEARRWLDKELSKLNKIILLDAKP